MDKGKGAYAPLKAKKTHDNHPAWYHRLMAGKNPWRMVEGEDFDDDLSELHESEEETDFEAEYASEDGYEGDYLDIECRCVERDPNCPCQFPGIGRGGGAHIDENVNKNGSTEHPWQIYYDKGSENSYTDDDTDYDDLKERRTERKRALRDRSRRKLEHIQRLRKTHAEKEKEVREIRQALVETEEGEEQPKEKGRRKRKRGTSGGGDMESPSRLALVGKNFDLYSTKYIDHMPPSLFDGDCAYGRPYVAFYHPLQEEGHWIDPGSALLKSPAETGGQITYLMPDFDYHFEAFRTPERGSTDSVTLKGSNGKHTVDFNFEFLSNDYFILRFRKKIFNYESERWRDMLLKQSSFPDAPDLFEFVGVRRELITGKVAR